MEALIQEVQGSLLNLIGQVVSLLPPFVIAVVILFLTRIVANVAQRIAAAVGDRTLSSRSLRILLAKTAYVTTWIVGILAASVIAFPGLSLGDLIAALGLGSVAVGFAFQDIFKNFLAGVLLLIREPFQLGDQLIIGDYEGTVEEINIRSTMVQTYQGERVVLPNSMVFTSPVQVRTAFSHRRTDLGVGVDYNTPLPEAAKILQRTITSVEGVLENPQPEIDLVGFGDSSINFVVRYWTAPQQAQVRRIQTRAIMAIKAAFDEADVTIPYPIRTLYFFDQQRFNDHFSLTTHSEPG